MDGHTLIVVLLASSGLTVAETPMPSRGDCEDARRKISWQGTSGLAYCVPNKAAAQTLAGWRAHKVLR